MNLAHIGVHGSLNAGDTVLFKATRDLFEKFVPEIEWTLFNLWAKYDEKVIDMLNAHDGIVIGGGGLFLKDTNQNNNSGWQWSCPIENLKKITKPIYVFGVGYNKFRGQGEFAPVFREHLTVLAEKSAFFGVRNKDSQRILLGLIPNSKIVYQPCPTTVLNHIYEPEQVEKTNKVGVNLAGDRPKLRYGGKENWLVDLLGSLGVELVSIKHLHSDMVIPDTEVVLLSGKPASAIIDFYRKTPLTIGTRGHSQMIPFGVGSSIASIVTHDKVGWFLDDIGHPEWGVDINEDIEGTISTRLRSYKDDTLLEEQERLWELTCNNMERMFNA